MLLLPGRVTQGLKEATAGGLGVVLSQGPTVHTLRVTQLKTLGLD